MGALDFVRKIKDFDTSKNYTTTGAYG